MLNGNGNVLVNERFAVMISGESRKSHSYQTNIRRLYQKALSIRQRFSHAASFLDQNLPSPVRCLRSQLGWNCVLRCLVGIGHRLWYSYIEGRSCPRPENPLENNHDMFLWSLQPVANDYTIYKQVVILFHSKQMDIGFTHFLSQRSLLIVMIDS